MAEAPRTFGDRMRLEREAQGWSKRALARHSQVDIGWISRVENGERHNFSWAVAIRIAEALGVSLDYLAGRSSQRTLTEVALAEGTQVGRRLPLLA